MDGTIVKHNGYLIDGKDTLLEGALEFLGGISKDDMIVFVTSRKYEYKRVTEDFLDEFGIRYNAIIYEAPFGERILVNDRKPSGLDMAISINVERDVFMEDRFAVDQAL